MPIRAKWCSMQAATLLKWMTAEYTAAQRPEVAGFCLQPIRVRSWYPHRSTDSALEILSQSAECSETQPPTDSAPLRFEAQTTSSWIFQEVTGPTLVVEHGLPVTGSL